MNGITTAAPAGIGGLTGLELGGAAGNILNHFAATPAAIQPDVKLWCTAIVAIAGAWLAHQLARVDLDHDGVPDFGGAAPPPPRGGQT